MRAILLLVPIALLGSTRAASAEETAESCGAWDIEYSLTTHLRITDTPMGKGDGVFVVGPGTVVMRFDDAGGRPGGRGWMLSYDTRSHFRIDARAFGMSSVIITDAMSHATPDACGIAADAVLDDAVLRWTTPVHGYHTDGTIDCSGSLCGSFGAPPRGTSGIHIPPGEVKLHDLAISNDLETFTMPYTLVSKTKEPQQTAFVSMAGREVKRTCVPAPRQCP
jgi:hypothetical protein